MTIQQIRVYVASKLKHAQKIHDIFSKQENIHLTSNWVHLRAHNVILTRPAMHWQQDNYDDIVRAHYVLAYVEKGEHLKGGLVEIGYAIRGQTPIFLTSDYTENDDPKGHPDYSQWQYGTPGIYRSSSIEKALKEMKRINGFSVNEEPEKMRV